MLPLLGSSDCNGKHLECVLNTPGRTSDLHEEPDGHEGPSEAGEEDISNPSQCFNTVELHI